MKKIHFTYLLLLLISLGHFSHAQNNTEQNDKIVEFYQNQQYLEAADYIKKTQTDTLYPFEVLSRLGYCYRMAKDYKNAEYYYSKALEKDSLNISTLSNLASINNGKGNRLAARKYYEQILNVDSNHINTLYTLAGLMRHEYDSTGSNLGSLLYEKVYQLQPNNIDIVLDYTQHLSDIKEFIKVDSILNEALKYDPENFYLAYKKAQVSFNLKNYKQAIYYGEKVTDLGGIDPDVIVMLGRSFYNIKEYQTSLSYYQKLVDNKFNIGEVDLYYMAIAMKELKRYKEAITYIDLALEQAISPNTVYYVGTKGDLHELNDEFTKAAAALQRSFNFEKLPNNYYKLALLYDFKIKNKQNAINNYRQYLKQKHSEEDQEVIDYVKKRLESLK